MYFLYDRYCSQVDAVAYIKCLDFFPLLPKRSKPYRAPYASYLSKANFYHLQSVQWTEPYNWLENEHEGKLLSPLNAKVRTGINAHISEQD
jgi:hypothetical protein